MYIIILVPVAPIDCAMAMGDPFAIAPPVRMAHLLMRNAAKDP